MVKFATEALFENFQIADALLAGREYFFDHFTNDPTLSLTGGGPDGQAVNLLSYRGPTLGSRQRIQNIVTDLKTFAYQKPGQDSMRSFLLENAVRYSECGGVLLALRRRAGRAG